MSNKKERLLSVGEAAERLGVTVDVIRSLADNGELAPARTGGGHRRFNPSDVDALKARWAARRHKQAPAPQATSGRATMVKRVVQRARLPLPRPTPRFDPTDWDDNEDPFVRQMARQAEEERLEADRKVLEAAAAVEERRLAGFRDHAETLLITKYDVPDAIKAQVLLDAKRWITTTSVPADLAEWAARQLVENQVNLLLKPHYDAVARAKKQKDDERKVEQLISDGNLYAFTETRNWKWGERQEALAEVEQELKAEVNASDTPGDVRDLVDGVLYEDPDEQEDGEQE